MAVHTLLAVQRIPVSLKEAWAFFSRPENLQRITPAYMGFSILSTEHGDRAYAGQIIEYKVKPVAGIPLYWMTEITHVQDEKYFVDEQRFGPYKLWHHQHHFREIEGGVEMKDLVHYSIPLGFIGGMANSLFVRRQLQQIFQYRYEAVEKMFGAWPGGDSRRIFLR